MNILFLTRLYSPHVGGVEKHVKNISQILSSKHRIVIVTEQFDHHLPLYEKYPEGEVYRIPVSGIKEKDKKWVIWKWFWQHRDLLKNADIIHAHDVFFWIIPLRLIFFTKNYFVTFHGREGTADPGFRQIFWRKLSEKLASGNICIGQFISKWYKTKPDIISYGAVAVTNYQIKNNKSKNIIYFGRLEPDTGIIEYLQAATVLKVHLNIYGDGTLMRQCLAMSQNNPGLFTFIGFKNNIDELIGNYRIAFVSGYLSILESLAKHIPVIACYSGLLKYDYLNMTPFSQFIKICNGSEEIIQAYKEITTHKRRTELMLQAGYNWVKDQTWEKLAGQYQTLWRTKSHLFKIV
jgi:glycosyltransferase involved in cell wall biosynthesis